MADKNYLEDNYLEREYLTVHGNNALGTQFEVIIDKRIALAFEYETTIANALKSLGFETEFYIGALKPGSLQYSGTINKETALATQFLAQISDTLKSLGFEFEINISAVDSLSNQFAVTIENKLKYLGTQFNTTISDKQSFLATQFSSTIADKTSSLSMQYSVTVDETKALGFQYSNTIDETKSLPLQYEVVIENKKQSLPVQYFKNEFVHIWNGYLVSEYLVGNYLEKGMLVILPVQYKTTIADRKHALPIQFQSVIDSRKSLPVQFEVQIDSENAIPFQFRSMQASSLALQYRVALYNTTNLRILCDFPSRGVSPGNWTASSTASGDFSVSNLNTDIIEQVWRSNTGAIVGINLICDTGLPQGVFLDTLAILNHNLTTSANVQLLGSNDPGFGTIGVIITCIITDRNYIYIAPTLPNEGFRYWKFIISDNTNPDNYLEIGTIVFGASTVFHGECFSNPIRYKKVHYSDSVMTEGFTNVNNDRGIKAKVGLTFEKLNFSGGNYENLVYIFEQARTNLKCLWVPTPQYPTRYGVFGKLTELPEETHTDNGEQADYVDLAIEIDEAK